MDEANKTINVKFQGSSFAKFVGEGKRIITSINDDEFQSMNPATSTGTQADSEGTPFAVPRPALTSTRAGQLVGHWRCAAFQISYFRSNA